MKRYLAVALLLVLGSACREAALASSDQDANPHVAICAAAHSIPDVLLAWHHQRIDTRTAMARLTHVRHMIADNATGPYARHLQDVAAAIRVFQITNKNHGDTSDAYRDLRTLRESLPRCPVPARTLRTSPAPKVLSG
jgi:hypothetical protein